MNLVQMSRSERVRLSMGLAGFLFLGAHPGFYRAGSDSGDLSGFSRLNFSAWSRTTVGCLCWATANGTARLRRISQSMLWIAYASPRACPNLVAYASANIGQFGGKRNRLCFSVRIVADPIPEATMRLSAIITFLRASYRTVTGAWSVCRPVLVTIAGRRTRIAFGPLGGVSSDSGPGW